MAQPALLATVYCALAAACRPPLPRNVPCEDDFECGRGYHCEGAVCIAGERGPAIAFASPEPGAVLRGQVWVRVEAVDPDGVSEVRLSSGDAEPFAVLAEGPFEASLDTTTLGEGRNFLYAKADDGNGSAPTTASIEVVVDNDGCHGRPFGDPCDDGIACTIDLCDGEGACIGADACAPGPCEASSACDRESGACRAAFYEAGTACDDGVACTGEGHCDGEGRCAAGPDRCPAGACEIAAWCNRGTGLCEAEAAPPGTPCDDGIGCTGDDACDGARRCAGHDGCAPGLCEAASRCNLKSGACEGTPIAGCAGVALLRGENCGVEVGLFDTIGEAVRALPAEFENDHCIEVRDGRTYPEEVALVRIGTVKSRLIVRAAPGQHPVVLAGEDRPFCFEVRSTNQVTIEGFECRGSHAPGSIGIRVEGSDSVVIRGNSIRGMGMHGVWVARSDGPQIASNRVFGNGGHGIAIEGAEVYAAVEDNTVFWNGGDGIRARAVLKLQVTGNRIAENGGEGIVVLDSPGAGIVRNVVDRGGGGVFLGPAPAAGEGAAILFNVVYAVDPGGEGNAEPRGALHVAAPSGAVEVANNIVVLESAEENDYALVAEEGLGGGALRYNNLYAPNRADSIVWDWLGYASVVRLCADLNEGCGSIAADPLFHDPDRTDLERRDFHLKSEFGRFDGGAFVADDETSPSLDAGDPESPVGDERLPNGGRVDQGFYGGTDEASKSAPVVARAPVCFGFGGGGNVPHIIGGGTTCRPCDEVDGIPIGGFATLQAAVDAMDEMAPLVLGVPAVLCLAASDVAPYRETVTVTGPPLGISQLRILPQGDGRPVVDAAGGPYCFHVEDAHDVELRGFECRNAASAGVLFSSAQSSSIWGARLHHNRLGAAVIDSLGVDIARSRIDSNGPGSFDTSGVYVAKSSAFALFWTVLTANDAGDVVRVTGESAGAWIGNNTFAGNDPGGAQSHGPWAVVAVDGASSDVFLTSNIVSLTSGDAEDLPLRVDSGATTGFSSDYNNLYAPDAAKVARWEEDGLADVSAFCAATGNDCHSLQGDPRFVDGDHPDPSARDFHLHSECGHVTNADPVNAVESTPAEGTSPSIDSGDPELRVDLPEGEPEPNGGRVDQGAYGGTPEASRTCPPKK